MFAKGNCMNVYDVVARLYTLVHMHISWFGLETATRKSPPNKTWKWTRAPYQATVLQIGRL